MVRASRDDDSIPSARQVLLVLVQDECCLFLLDAEELIHQRVYFSTDLFARQEARHDKLAVRAREQHVPEVGILERLFFNRSSYAPTLNDGCGGAECRSQYPLRTRPVPQPPTWITIRPRSPRGAAPSRDTGIVSSRST